MPDWRGEVRERLSALRLHPARVESIVEEVSAHLEDCYRELLAAGMAEMEARATALQEIDAQGILEEELQHLDRLPAQQPRSPTSSGKHRFLEETWIDLRYGLRSLAKNPCFAIIAVLTLGLGIGINTALFSIVNSVLLNPLPFPQPEQLVTLHESKPNFDRGSISYPNFLDWQKNNHTFAAMAVFRSITLSLTGVGETERVSAEFVTSDFFPILGVKPVIGRMFGPREDRIGAAPEVLISEGFWERKFGRSPRVLGRTLALDGQDYPIVGVVPASFHLSIPAFRERDAYLPFSQWVNNLLMTRTAGLGIHGIGRLKPGVTMQQANADMDSVTTNLALAYPEADKGIGAALVPLRQQIVGRVQPLLLVLLGAVGFVLLIACVNVANLMLARSTSRAREFAVRAALGASQGRVVRQLLAESVLLALAGGGLGLWLAVCGTPAVLSRIPAVLPRAVEVGLDARVLIFTLSTSMLSGTLFGLAPALKIARPHLLETLQSGCRGESGTRYTAHGVFVAIEMALALVLLIGAALMVRTLGTLWGVNPGFNPRHVLTFNLALAPSATRENPQAVRSMFRNLHSRLAAIPGVQAASVSWGAFPFGWDDEQLFWMEGQPKPQSDSEMNWALSYVVEPDYLKAMGIPLERGRFLTPQDDEHSPLVIAVDETFARKFFPHEDPIGKRVMLDDYGKPAQIVGVVGHVKQWGLDLDDERHLQAQLYLPFMQLQDVPMALLPGGIFVAVRASGSPLALLDSLRETTGQLNSQRVIYDVQPMEEIVSNSLRDREFMMILLAAFAALALVLASVGLYGVTSYLIGQRTHEIGMRMVLGAQRMDVLRWVLGLGSRMTLAGVAAGLLAAFGLTRVMVKYSMLFQVSATDPATFCGVALLLTFIALLACYIPARRAMRVDPMNALRHE
jgi:putative ABC transport system permease protein